MLVDIRFNFFCFLAKQTGFALLALWSLSAWGQDPDSALHELVLEEVRIQATRMTLFSAGNKSQTFDSGLLVQSFDQNLADLLGRYSPVYIRSYGVGGLASPSFRGSGAGHTPILWNGFNLQSPLNGQVDFSLVPTYLMEDVTLQFGGAGALFGSGAVGGVIYMNQMPAIVPGFLAGIDVGAGSFGGYFQGIRMGYGKKDKWSNRLKAFHRSSENDFPYINKTLPGSPTTHQTNAGIEQSGLVNDFRWKPGPQSQLDIGLWYQITDREIPPTMTQASSNASQEDESFRMSTQLRQTVAGLMWTIRSALFAENNLFEDPEISLSSLNQSLAWISEAELDGDLGPLCSWNAGLQWSNYNGESQNFGGRVHQDRAAGFGSIKLNTFNGRLNGVFSVRQELFDGEPGPVVPTIGVEMKPGDQWSLKGSIARNYRIPTMNDLYWRDSFARGNPNLEPESGWSQDITVQYQVSDTRRDFRASLAVFNSRIENWILWAPDSVSVWSPNNILSVRSRGVEASLDLGLDLGMIQLDFSPQYSWVKATNEAVAPGSESGLGKQLIYMPQHNLKVSSSIRYRKFRMAYDHSHTAKTFTTTDNTEALPAYGVGNLVLSATTHFARLDWRFSGEIRNLWNKDYQVITFRPMPLRNFQITVTTRFTK